MSAGTQENVVIGFGAITALDYTVLFARNMDAMRAFYEGVLGLKVSRELSRDWIEYKLGGTILTLARPKRNSGDAVLPLGSASLQLAFKVPIPAVDQCADALAGHGVPILAPPTDQSFGHRTLFFRDPDGNLLEIYAEI